MILTLKVETLHKLLKCVEIARNEYCGDNVYSANSDTKDFIEIALRDVGFKDKKKKIHELATEENIGEISIRVNYELCEDIKVEWG